MCDIRKEAVTTSEEEWHMMKRGEPWHMLLLTLIAKTLVGAADGALVGVFVGPIVGVNDGVLVGFLVGCLVDAVEGDFVGFFVGPFVDDVEGVLVGAFVVYMPRFGNPGVRKRGPVHIEVPITRCNE